MKALNIGIATPLSLILKSFLGVNKDFKSLWLCPLYFFFLIPAVFLIPCFYGFYLLKALKDGFNVHYLCSFKHLLFDNIIYLILIFILYKLGYSYYYDTSLQFVENLNQMTNADPKMYEILAAQRAKFIVSLSISLVLINLLISAFFILKSCIYLRDGDAPYLFVLTVVFKNLHSYLLYAFVIYVVFFLLERLYASMTINYMINIRQGVEYFNPSILFIVIRVYLVTVFAIAFSQLSVYVGQLVELNKK